MNLADYLRRQFAYDEWANREVLNAIRAAGAKDSGAAHPAGANQRSLQLMSHILAAELLWLERLKQQPQSLPVWPEPDLAQCEAQASKLGGQWMEFLDLITAGDVSQSISYTNSKGEQWTSTIVDVLTHVVLHSAYHRGQIASHMRAGGQAPAYTDFIHGVRQELFK
ncbi:MAG TPA: DinB family protein [Candidatus Sulfotelmatobacter sp.]|nr:DinB family protein [Candidatus Sulfotelmatobacter sp.]